MSIIIMRGRSRLPFAPAVLALAVASLTAYCGGEDEPEPQVQTIRLVISGAPAQTIDIDRATATPAVVITPGAHTVTATFLRANGEVETLVDELEFELRLSFTPTGVATFQAGAVPFTGTLTGVAAGTTTMEVELFHLLEGHADFEKSVTLTVSN